MTVAEMHYIFKQELNKLDSERYRIYQIPEIDILLNRAQEQYIKMVAFPHENKIHGFEITQRDIDSIRTIVVEDYYLQKDEDRSRIKEYSYWRLPDNYWFFINGKPILKDEECGEKEGKLIIRQHEDRFEWSPFDRSDWLWAEVNGVFTEDYIKVYHKDFEVSQLCINYIRRPVYIHYAQGYNDGKYLNMRGEMLTGTQDCELPEVAHMDIVNLAVYFASQQSELPATQLKATNIKLT